MKNVLLVAASVLVACGGTIVDWSEEDDEGPCAARLSGEIEHASGVDGQHERRRGVTNLQENGHTAES